jgi:hypothetical protein
MLHSALIEHVNAGAHDVVIGLTLTWGARVRDHAALHPGHRSFRCSLICAAASVFLDAWVRSGCPEAVAEEEVEEMDEEEMVDALDALGAEGAAEQTNTKLRKFIVAGHWIEVVSPVICHGDVGLAVYFVSMVDDD